MNAKAPLLAAVPRPFRVVASYTRRRHLGVWLLRTLAVALSLVFAFALQDEWRELQRHAALRDDPQAIEVPADFEGRVSSRFGLLPSYRGTVVFDGADGRRQRGVVAFTAWHEVAPGTRTTVRFRPDAPDGFVFSWALAVHGQRWSLLGVAILLAFVFVLLPWRLAQAFQRQLQLVAALAHDGQELLGELRGIDDVKQHGRVVQRVHKVDLVVDGARLRLHAAFAPRHGGAFLVGEQHVLLLWSKSRPKQALVLREDLWPLQVDAATVAKVRAMALAYAPTDAAPAGRHA